MTDTPYSKLFLKCNFVVLTLLCVLNSVKANDPCLIRTDIEPDILQTSFVPVLVNSSDGPNQAWENPSFASHLDGQTASLTLNPLDISNQIIFKDFYFNIPQGAKINGLQLKVTGASSDNSILDEKQIQWLLDGSPVGNNFADKSVITSPWKQDMHSWLYGYDFSDWDLNPTYEMLNSNELSLAIAIENDSDSDTLNVFIDHIEIIIHYEPLYTVCGDECVVVYNDEVPGVISYEWTLPLGVEFLNSDHGDRVVNLDFNDAETGLLDIELTIYRDADTLTCSRQILKDGCGPADIGDLVWFDENFDGLQDPDENGIGGIQLELYSPLDELIATTVSGANGQYQFSDVERGFYYIQVNSELLIATVFNSDDALNSDINEDLQTSIFLVESADSITTLDAGLFAESTIAGGIWVECDGNGIFDSDENYIADIEVELYEDNFLIDATTTDGTGQYVFENLRPGVYTVLLKTTENVSVGTNENLFDQVNEVVVDLGIAEDREDVNGALNPLSTYEFEIFVDNNGNGSYDANETLLDGTALVLSNGTTSYDGVIEEGQAVFTDLPFGTYTLQFENVEEFTIAESDANFTEDGTTVTFDLESPDCNNTNSFLLIFTDYVAALGDYVWEDSNGNGIQDADEKGLGDIEIKLINFTTADIQEQVLTDENGYYEFENPPAGNYLIVVDAPTKYINTISDVDPELGSKINFVADQFVMGPIAVENGTVDLTWDAGFILFNGTISGSAWVDFNPNNVLDVADFRLENVEVTLFSGDDAEVAIDKTDVNGNYSFSNVVPGEYYVSFAHVGYTDFVDFQVGSDPLIDSDVNNSGKTDLFSVSIAGMLTGINAGFEVNTGTVGDYVFLDLNENGLFDDDEIGLQNFQIKAFDLSGFEVATTTSEQGGFYQLILPAGTYYLEFTKDGFETPTIYNSTNEDKNSDVTEEFGPFTTGLITIFPGSIIDDIDAGFTTIPSVIGDIVWNDINSNAIQDIDEVGVRGLQVNLIKVGEGVVMTTTTGNGQDTFPGLYHFDVDQPGEYYIEFEIENDGYSFTQYNNDNKVSNENGFGTTPAFFVEPGENYSNKDAGVVTSFAMIGNYVWNDENQNGLQDVAENGINGISVFLYDDLFNFLDVTITTYNALSKADGHYYFEDLQEGNYILVFDADQEFATSFAGTDGTKDSDVTSEFVQGSTGIIQLDDGEKAFDIDGGVIVTSSDDLGSIGDFVWNDINVNGIQDTSEPGIEGIEIILLDDQGVAIESTFSIENGSYIFDEIPAGSYRISIVLIDDYEVTIPNNSFDDLTDSDIQSNGNSLLFTLAENENITNLDIGLKESDGLQNEEVKYQFAREDETNLQEENDEVESGAFAQRTALEVYPIPAREFISLKINKPLNETAKIELITAEGVVLKTIFREDASEYVHVMNTEGYKPGFYYVRVTDGINMYFKKFIIQ